MIKRVYGFKDINWRVNSNYDEYKQRVNNKMMHTLNGNIDVYYNIERSFFSVPSVSATSNTRAVMDPTQRTAITPVQTNPDDGSVQVSTISVALNAPVGTTVDLHIGGNVKNPSEDDAQGRLSVAVNGDTHVVGEVSEDGVDEGVAVNGIVTFVSQIENVIDVIWEDLSDVGSYFIGLLSGSSVAQEATSIVIKRALIVYYCFTAEGMMSTLNLYPVNAHHHDAARRHIRMMLSHTTIYPIFQFVSSYARFLQIHHNRIQHALNGNMEDQVVRKDAPKGKKGGGLYSSAKLEAMQMKKMVDIKNEVQAVANGLTLEVEYTDVVLTMIADLEQATDPVVHVVISGIVCIFEFYEQPLALDNFKKAIRYQKQRVDTDDPLLDREMAFKNIEEAFEKKKPFVVQYDKDKQKDKQKDKIRENQPGKPMEKTFNPFANKDEQVDNIPKQKALTAQQAEENYKNSVNRIVDKYTTDPSLMIAWLIHSPVSVKFKRLICERVFPPGWEDQDLTKGRNTELIAYVVLNKLELIFLTSFFSVRYGNAGPAPDSFYLQYLPKHFDIDEYKKMLKEKHNKLMHALCGNTTMDVIDASLDFDAFSTAADSQKTSVHYLGWETAVKLGTMPTSEPKAVSDYAMADYLLASVKNVNGLKTEGCGIRPPLSFMIPRECRTAAGPLAVSLARLQINSVGLVPPPFIPGTMTSNGTRLADIVAAYKGLAGRNDGTMQTGFNFNDTFPLICAPLPYTYAADAHILKLYLLMHCLLNKDCADAIPIGNITFFDNHTVPNLPLRTSMSDYLYNHFAQYGEDLGGNVPVAPYNGGEVGLTGTFSIHLSHVSIPYDYRSYAIYLPSGFVNGSGTVSAINFVIFLIMFIYWPFGFFGNTVNTTDVNGANPAAQFFMNAACCTAIPAPTRFYIVMPRIVAQGDPSSTLPLGSRQGNAASISTFQPRTGPTPVPGGMAANSPLLFSVTENVTEHNLSQFLYTWFKGNTIKRSHVMDFLGLMGQYVNIEKTSEAMIDVAAYLCYRSGSMIITNRGNVNPADQFLPESVEMQYTTNLDSRDNLITVANWPRPRRSEPFLNICESHPVAWGLAALDLVAQPVKPQIPVNYYRFCADNRWYVDLEFIATYISLTFHIPYLLAGYPCELWNKAVTGQDGLARSVRNYCTSFFSAISSPHATDVPYSATGTALWQASAQIFKMSAATVNYGLKREISIYHRMMNSQNQVVFQTAWDQNADLYDPAHVPCLWAGIWYDLLGYDVPRFLRDLPITTDAAGLFGYSDSAELDVVNMPGHYTGYVDTSFVTFYGDNDAQYRWQSGKSKWNQRIAWWMGAFPELQSGVNGEPLLLPSEYPTQRMPNFVAETNVLGGFVGVLVNDIYQNNLAMPTVDGNSYYYTYRFTTSGNANLLKRYQIRNGSANTNQWIMNVNKLTSNRVEKQASQIAGPGQRMIKPPSTNQDPALTGGASDKDKDKPKANVLDENAAKNIISKPEVKPAELDPVLLVASSLQHSVN